MIKRLDEALGRLTDALRSLDILDNTIILFTTGSRLPLQDPQRRVQTVLSREQYPHPDGAVRAGL